MKNLMVVLGVVIFAGGGLFGDAQRPVAQVDEEVCNYYVKNLNEHGFAEREKTHLEKLFSKPKKKKEYEEFNLSDCTQAFDSYRKNINSYKDFISYGGKSRDELLEEANGFLEKLPDAILITSSCIDSFNESSLKAISLMITHHKQKKSTTVGGEQTVKDKIAHAIAEYPKKCK